MEVSEGHSPGSLTVVGYTTGDELFHGYPQQSVQNLAVRRFVESRGHTFSLSWAEKKGATPFMLRSLLVEGFYQGICFYSLEQFAHFDSPYEWLERLAEKSQWVGFAAEELCFSDVAGKEAARRLLWLKLNVERNPHEQVQSWVGNRTS